MMKSFTVLFDRIIANRLKSWLNFNVDRTAFQKLKFTLVHVGSPVHPCDKPSQGGCEQLCLKHGMSPICRCESGFRLD